MHRSAVKMESRILLAAGALRPSSLYASFGSAGVDSRHTRCVSSGGKPKTKTMPPGNMKEPLPRAIEKKNKNIKPLTYRRKAPPQRQPVATLPNSPSSSLAQRTAAFSISGLSTGVLLMNHALPGDYTAIPEYVTWPGDTQTMPLPDGGVLGCTLMGYRDKSRNRTPLLAFHGTPGSRLSNWYLHKWAESHGIPLIAPERPGCGILTYKENYNVVDHALDAFNISGTSTAMCWASAEAAPLH